MKYLILHIISKQLCTQYTLSIYSSVDVLQNNCVTMHLNIYFRKEIKLPSDMTRSMAAEAEAARQARAKVIFTSILEISSNLLPTVTAV